MGFIDHEERRIARYSARHFGNLVKLPDSLLEVITAGLSKKIPLEYYILPLHEREGGNGKGGPATELCFSAEKQGRIYPGVTVIVPSSGNTVLNVIYRRRAWGIAKVVPVLKRTVPLGKQVQLLVPGGDDVHIEYPREGQTTIERAIELEREGIGVFLNQYGDPASIIGQFPVMDHIINEMESRDEDLCAFGSALGTTSMTCAAFERLNDAFPGTHIIGGACMDGSVPGARTVAELEEGIEFDWKTALGPLGPVLCGQYASFATSRKMVEMTSRVFGPSCGMAVVASTQRFQSLFESGELEKYVHLNRHGKYTVVMPSMDTSLVYADEYAKVLGLGGK
jgi:cysteine synthase